eukprot:1160094-Pelagomonas_calceolata.AAC.3
MSFMLESTPQGNRSGCVQRASSSGLQHVGSCKGRLSGWSCTLFWIPGLLVVVPVYSLNKNFLNMVHEYLGVRNCSWERPWSGTRSLDDGCTQIAKST